MQSCSRKCQLFSAWGVNPGGKAAPVRPCLARLKSCPFKTLPPDVHHRSRSWHKIRLADVMTLFLPRHYPSNEFNQLFIRSTAAHEFVHIVIPNGKKTSPNLAIGSNSN